MSRHSRNNTAGAVFTYAEKQKLRHYGTQEIRVGKDSMRHFDACYLCLKRPASEPVACELGHLSCRSCTLELILAQKNEIKRLETESTAHKNDRDREERTRAKREREQQVERFVSQQSIITTSDSVSQPSIISISDSAGKREQKSQSNFWIPAMTPSADEAKQPVQKQVMCTATSTLHPLAMKKLHAVVFHNPKEPSCPMCIKTLSNALGLVVFKPCGHVFCARCFESLLKTTQECVLCGEGHAGSFELAKEGTGFAGGGGKVLARKHEVAFR